MDTGPTLRVALAKVDVLPPERVTDDANVLTFKDLAFEPLLAWHRGRVGPGLFSRWTHSPDGRRWEFFIRDGAGFHDGKPCTPADVLAVIDGIVNSVDTFGMKWSYARYLAQARIEAGSARSIRVEHPEPFADILDVFSEFYVSRRAPDGRATIGTGAYRILEIEPRRRAVLERVATGSTAPTRIVLDEVPAAEDRWQALQAGATDVAMQLDHMRRPPPRDARFRWFSCPVTLSVMYYLNCTRPPFAAPAARMAANLAIDKAGLIETVFHGLAVPAATIVSPWHLGMASMAPAPIAYDPNRARALLDGIGGPREILLRTPTHMPERATDISRFVADALERIGFRVAIEIEPDRPEYARQVGRKQIGDLAMFDSSPHSTFRVLNDKISSATKAVWWQGYDDAETERLIRAANHAVEPAAREAAYGACLRRLNADPPWLYLVHPIALSAAKHGAATQTVTPKGTLSVA